MANLKDLIVNGSARILGTLYANLTGNASTATTLQTARNFRTNLGSTSTGSFNGSADCNLGVTGTLPVANGGTGQTSIADIKAGKDSDGNTISSTYAKTASLATVATSGSYNDLSNKPTIPTVNNATLTIQKNGTNVKTFTANASTDVTANITVPTKTSELTNDSKYISNTATASMALGILGDTNTVASSINIGSGSKIVSNSSHGAIALGHSTEVNNNNRGIAINGTIDNSSITFPSVDGGASIAIRGFVENSENATAIGGSISGAGSAIQIGYGQNTTANSMNVGFYNDSSTHYNWELLDGTTGLIPDARISSNIARASAIPTVNNATLTIQKNGTTVKTFTANASTNVTANITVPTQASDINAQATLVSGTNIKTINGNSILGSGDLTLSGGLSYSATCPAITIASGVATWNVTHNLGTQNIVVSLYDSSGNLQECNVTVTSANAITVAFKASSNITAGDYKIVVLASGASATANLWVNSYYDFHNGSNLYAGNTPETYTVDLSSYLPNDNAQYEVMLLVAQANGNMIINTDFASSFGGLWGTSSARNSMAVVVGAGRYIHLVVYSTSNNFYMNAVCYRKVG